MKECKHPRSIDDLFQFAMEIKKLKANFKAL